ncbi:F-box only protein 39-like [Thunnus maccoyii]|uniref:F-box only protein 39-like n=1 Tax=Thunnus maccoyii TaxID=8240 RepID=UPI001C4D0CE0|nr:F-box only protein 39-like [Thunnus maccoyii]
MLCCVLPQWTALTVGLLVAAGKFCGTRIIQTKMDEDNTLRDDNTWEENFSDEDEDSEGETGEDDSDLSEEGGEGSSMKKTSCWGILPDVCLRHVFSFLPDGDRMSADVVCHHWHKVMRSPSLWRFRLFQFSGRLSKFRQSEYCSSVGYARSLGVYLERLEVSVCPPRRSLIAQRLEQTISGLFSELTRVKAPLKSLTLIKLELDRTAWTLGLRNSLVNCLIHFLRKASKLTTISLNWMRNSMHQGLELLSALSHSQRRFPPTRCYISSLNLEGFFSGAVPVHLNSNVPCIMRHLQGLTDLSLSYSCLSDELLMALQHRHRGGRLNPRRDEITLQTFSLHCTLNEPHRQPVCGGSWATLASSSPDLKVKITVHQVINTDRLARILRPEIPLTEYTMVAFYSPDEGWTAKPVLCDMLPQYSRSLQHLSLDLSNCSEPLDVELLELVKMCERLEHLGIWAFLEVITVEKLLHIRLTQRSLLNNIRVRIYSVNDNTVEQEDQLEQILSSYLQLPPELEFFAMIYPFV